MLFSFEYSADHDDVEGMYHGMLFPATPNCLWCLSIWRIIVV
jgi:hypothetical protein